MRFTLNISRIVIYPKFSVNGYTHMYIYIFIYLFIYSFIYSFANIPIILDLGAQAGASPKSCKARRNAAILGSIGWDLAGDIVPKTGV